MNHFTFAWIGSTIDAMSDAVDQSDVMLYGVSLAYKESANVRAASPKHVALLSGCWAATSII